MPKDKRMKSRLKKMKGYIKDGRVKKMKRLHTTITDENLQHLFIEELNSLHGSRQRTYLHCCCENGDSAMIQTLIEMNADIEVTDSNGSNVLHYVLNYTLESCDSMFFEKTVLFLLSLASRTMMEAKNKYGETADALLEEVMALLNNKQKTFLLDPDDEEDEEREWNEKLFHEMVSEDRFGNEGYAQEEHNDTYKKTKEETYSEWGDRMRAECRAKNKPPSPPPKTHSKSKVPNENNTREEALKHGPSLVSELRKKLEILKLREKYENACKELFSSDSSKSLQFSDISWPLSFGYKDIIENIERVLSDMMELLSYGLEGEERIKYLKKQQVRWHPDRFLQKCGSRLKEEDKDDIMEIVNHLSQRINSTIDSLS